MTKEDFLRMEKKYGLNNRTYEGFAYWTYGRFEVSRYIDNIKSGIPNKDAGKKVSAYELIKDVLAFGGNVILRGNVPKKQRDICIFNHERRIKEGNYYECVYTERIAEYYDSVIVIERPYGYTHFKPVKTENLVYSDGFSAYSYYRGMLDEKLKSPKYKRAKAFFLSELEEVIEEIERIDAIKIDREKFINIFTHIYLIYIRRKKSIEKLLNRISPLLIIEVVGYNVDCMIANEIAKEKGIVTVELQHGIMGQNHFAYNYNWGEHIAQFPDKVLLFADFWRKCSQLPISEQNSPAVGYPFFEKKVQQYLPIKLRKAATDRITLLFVSQWTIGKALSKLAVDLYNYVDHEKVRIIYKLHPGEYNGWREEYVDLEKSGIEVIDTQEHSIYEYFAISDIQVGVYSTALYEGLAFGLKTFIYSVYNSENMRELCEEGYAQMITSVDEILTGLDHFDNSQTSGMGSFWKENSLQNIFKEIDQILKK